MSATSQSTTFRFFGILKNLFSRAESNGAPATRPSGKTSTPAATNGTGHVARHPDRSNGKAVVLPLQTVIMAMSQELRSRIRAAVSDGLTITVPLDKIMTQLGKGTVKIPFGDIRRAASHIFTPGTECDHLPVALPLSEILPRINTSALTRRADQKQVEVSDEITGPFNGGAEGVKFVDESPMVPAQNPATVRTLSPRKVPAITAVPAMNGSPATTFMRRPTSPSATPPSATPRASVSFAPTPSPAPAALTKPPLRLPEARPIAMPAARPFSRTTPAPAAAMPQTISAEPLPVSPIAAALVAPALTVGLTALADAWPETLRQEIVKMNLVAAQVALPMNLVEHGLKRGRVAFPWKTIRSWIRPPVTSTTSVHDDIEFDLSLKVLAPMFFAEQKAAKAHQQKVSLDETIPNLFFGFPQPEAPSPEFASTFEPTAAPAVAAPVEAPIAASAFAPVDAPAARPAQAAKPVETNYYVWNDSSDTAFMNEAEFKRKPVTETEFLRRYPTPNELVSRATELEGVAGAIIALPDGLSVASHIPTEMNGDTIAAFLPQLFSKVSQCTKELRMGQLNNLNFTVGNVPWKIFRVNAVFFAAFGRAGQSLPSAQLAALASELDRNNK